MAVNYKIIGGDGLEYGPVTLEEIRQWCEEGRVSRDTRVWRSDEQRWRTANDWDELKWDLPQPPPARLAGPESAGIEPPVEPSGPATLHTFEAAGFGMRLGAFVLDWVVLTALITIVTLPWAEPLTQLQQAAMTEAKSPNPNLALLTRFWLISLAINLPISLAYNTWFNGRRGATPGKHLLGMRVVREDGSPLGYGRAALRFLAELVSLLTFGAGYLMILVHPEKRALHDLIAGTRVIRRGPFT